MLKPRYHHGDLRNALLSAGSDILKQGPPSELSLREMARRAGVSHAAPYRHFPSFTSLLVALAEEGFIELRAEISAVATLPENTMDRISGIGEAYTQFVVRQPALTRLMFGSQIANREAYPQLSKAAEAIGTEIGIVLNDGSAGFTVWAALHGVTMLILENVIDTDQCRIGLDALPSRAQIMLHRPFC